VDETEWHECTLLDCLGRWQLVDVQQGVGNPPTGPSEASTDSTWILWTVIADPLYGWRRYFLAMEDPEDGYRSCLGTLYTKHEQGKPGVGGLGIWGQMTIAPSGETISFAAGQSRADSPPLLVVGTDTDDPWYPCFVASWNPPKKQTQEPPCESTP